VPNVYQPGLVQIRPQYSVGGDDTAENILWAKGAFTSNLTLSQIQAVQSAFDTAWANLWKPQSFDTSEYLGNILTDWSSNTGLQNDTVTIFTPVHGTGGTAPAGAQVCILQSLSTGIRYRGGHPRTYFPGVSADILIDPSHIQTSNATTMVTAYNAVNTALQGVSSGNGGPFNFVIYLHKSNSTLAHVYPIAEYAFDTQLATQRRRLRKVTRHG
jgi:hypothetical protein